MANRVHIYIDPDLLDALAFVSQKLDIRRSVIVRHAIVNWAVTRKITVAQKQSGRTHFNLELGEGDRNLIEAWCEELQVTPTQVIGSALQYWLMDCAFLAKVETGIIKPRHFDRDRGRPTKSDKEISEQRKILQRQLDYYRSVGNTLRIPQIQQQLKALESVA